MTYDPDQPQQDLPYYDSSSTNAQGVCLENFSEADTVYSVDHVGFSANSDVRGYHKAIRFLDNGGDPDTSDGYSVLYTKSDGTHYVPWFRQKNNGVAVPLTDAANNVWGIYTTVAAVIFNRATGAIIGTSKNIASVSPPSPSGSSFIWDITFTSAIPVNSPFSILGEKSDHWLSAYSTAGCSVQTIPVFNDNITGRCNLVIMGGVS